jgi:hypothetical protein
MIDGGAYSSVIGEICTALLLFAAENYAWTITKVVRPSTHFDGSTALFMKTMKCSYMVGRGETTKTTVYRVMCLSG